MKTKTVPMKAQAALGKFVSARSNFWNFQRQHTRILEEYEALRDAYNEALDGVKAVYKDHHDIIGPKLDEFSVHIRTDIDADLLIQLMGPAVDPLLKTKYSIDRDLYRTAIERGIVPGDVVEKVETNTPVIYGPKRL
jgi:hypothetical protein